MRLWVSPVKFRQDGRLAVRCLGLKDTSGFAKVALFSDLAEESYIEGKVVELSGLYKKEHQNKPQLAMTRGTSCQFLPDDSLELTIDDTDGQHFRGDVDFLVQVEENCEKYEIDAIYEVVSYECCTNTACHKKKMVNGLCPTCQGDLKTWTCRAKLSITAGDIQKDITLFQNVLEKHFGQITSIENETSTLGQFLDCLPVYFSAKLQGNNVYNVCKL